MKRMLLGCFVFALVACEVLGDIETCTDVSNCSENMKTKCTEMSDSLKNTDQKLVLACRNGICMCNVDFPGNVRHSTQAEKLDETGKTEAAETGSDD